MIRNYFKVAIRNMMKRKGYSALNILGLAIGMAVCLIIVLFVSGELNYDNFHSKGDRIYRLVLERKYPGRSTSYAIIPYSIGVGDLTCIANIKPTINTMTEMFGEMAINMFTDHTARCFCIHDQLHGRLCENNYTCRRKQHR